MKVYRSHQKFKFIFFLNLEIQRQIEKERFLGKRFAKTTLRRLYSKIFGTGLFIAALESQFAFVGHVLSI